MAAEQAISTASLVQSLGVNTHLDFGGSYANLAVVEAAINYLGISNLRDSPGNSGDVSLWQQVAQATGAKFDAFIGETSPSGMSSELATMQQIAQTGILNYMEGGNEEDDAYPASLGNNLSITASFQQQLYAAAQAAGLPAINMSFGAGWTAANNWIGDYGNVGDLSAFANYANGHTYPQGAPNSSIEAINSDAHLAASARPVITTEFGYDTNTTNAVQAAKWTLDATLDAMQDGDVKLYFYALFDDQSGAFGLMNPDGSPKPAGAALHNLTSLLKDTGGAFSPGTLAYTIDNTAAGDNSLLMEKSDGSYWLALWNESNSGHTVTLNLASPASEVEVFDPLTGTTAVQSASDTSSLQINVPDHPVLVEIIPAGGTAPPPAQTTTTTTTTTSTQTTPPPQPAAGNGMSIAAPASVQDTTGQGTAVAGVSISDPYALSHPDTVTVSITDQGGMISTVNAFGATQQGSGASGLTITGTIWQVNAALANLNYSGDGADTIQISATDQDGNQASATTTVNGGAGVTPTDPTPTPAPSGNTISIAAGDATPVEAVNSATINASSGDHMIFIAGTNDTLTATGGTESVQAYQGGNSITTGAGNDTIRFAGSGNTINAGGGDNQLMDSGSNNTIVLPGAGQGNDNILGWVMQNGDTFDLRPALAQTGWNGDTSTLGGYVQVAMSGDNAIISIDPNGTSRGTPVATLNDVKPMTLSTLLAHAIT